MATLFTRPPLAPSGSELLDRSGLISFIVTDSCAEPDCTAKQQIARRTMFFRRIMASSFCEQKVLGPYRLGRLSPGSLKAQKRSFLTRSRLECAMYNSRQVQGPPLRHPSRRPLRQRVKFLAAQLR